MIKAGDWIKKLKLIPHPEGGYYKEIYSSKLFIENMEDKAPKIWKRSLSTSIYFLLRSGDFSKFHRLKSDELWYFHTGSSLTLYSIDEDGNMNTTVLGDDLEKNEIPQSIIPAGTIFGACVNELNSFTLIGCMVSPGFNFEDFELINRKYLLKKYTKYKDIILKLTSPS